MSNSLDSRNFGRYRGSGMKRAAITLVLVLVAVALMILYAPEGGLWAQSQFGNPTGGAGSASLPTGLTYVAPTLTVSSAGTGNAVVALSGNTSGTATFTAPAVAGTVTNQVLFSNALGGPDGGVNNPTYSFTGGTATGMFRGGSGEVIIAAGATSVASFLGTGVTLNAAGTHFAFAGGKGQHIKTQAANNDLAGTCTFAATTCTVTFTTAYTATPSCVANDRTAAAPIQSAPTTSNVVFTGGTGAGATDVVNYICMGNPN